MTDFKALIREGAEASRLMAPGDARNLIARLTTALEETHEVAVGSDHTAAKYWRRMREAEVAAGVAEDRVKRAQAGALREFANSLDPYAGTVLNPESVAEMARGNADQVEKEAGA